MPKSKLKKIVSGRQKNLETIVSSRQFDLFTNFWGDSEDLSNTIELWDAIPKYSFTPRRQNKVRDEKGRLTVHSHSFVTAKRSCRVEIQPASIKLKDGTYQDFYPSGDEELVEEVLRKIFADQQYGRHDAQGNESWVKFSLQMIRKELNKRGKSRSIDQIKRSIDILAKTHISFYVEDDVDPIYMNPILSDVTRVTRENFLNDGTSMWWAKLPALVSKSVNDLSYRQFNYGTLMNMQSQLARWLHKRLTHRYTNASVVTPYGPVTYSSLQRDSGLLTHPRINANISALEAALEELKCNDVLLFWEKTDRRGTKNRITEVLYTLHATPAFAAEVKAANARRKGSAAQLQESGS